MDGTVQNLVIVVLRMEITCDLELRKKFMVLATSMFEKKFLCGYQHTLNTNLMQENDRLGHVEMPNLIFDNFHDVTVKVNPVINNFLKNKWLIFIVM